jgi:hypothetical protein
VSAAELVFGTPLQLPAQFLSAAEPPPSFFVEQLNSVLLCVAPLPPPAAATASPSPQLMAADFVYIRAPPTAPVLSPPYRGPYAVHKRSLKEFIIKMGGRFEAVSVDRLKPHLGSSPWPASPPRRGRPPRLPAT